MKNQIISVLKKTFRLKLSGVDKRVVKGYFLQQKIRKLNIGCGNTKLDGWLNADIFPKSGQMVYLDATKTFPFDNETFDYVYSEHMIEHLPFAEGLKMLHECYRVLKKAGKIRISTPDLSSIIALYNTDKTELQKEFINHSAETSNGNVPYPFDTYVINNFVRDWGHQFIYDEKVLRFALKKAGFERITRCELNKSEDENLRNLENDERLPEGFLKLVSFTLEGIK